MIGAKLEDRVEQRMQKVFEALRTGLSKIRTGRVHADFLDHVLVDYYGSVVPISQVASVTVVDARTLSVQPWEEKMLPTIEKSIRESDLGVNPSRVGGVLRVPMPLLTEERRRDLVKVVQQKCEGAKVAMRNVRRDGNSELKERLKNKEISADEERNQQEGIQKITVRFVAEVDKACQHKTHEIMLV